jgi:TonB-dependent SusC/RagA subfamily outer membrane receptor
MTFFRQGVGGAVAIAVVLMGAADAARAQRVGELTGLVTYAGTGEVISGVLVLLPALNIGKLTDDDGRFTMTAVPAGRHEIVTALLGCQLESRSVDVEAGKRLAVDIKLTAPVITLEGLEAVAVATDRPVAELPYSVGRVDARSTDAGTTRTVGSMIQGRIAGARVVQGSGQPGAEPTIQFRGPTSIGNGHDPLVVVDGVITRSRISDIDPLDIEHVEVLKGAAAAAIYGARGQAGVIEITTRRGPSRASASRGPLVIVNGVVSQGGLADIDPAAIDDIRFFEGAAAAVLYGARAGNGVIQVTTQDAPPEASRPPFCRTR